ncbi:hypothetical protein [Streptomyces sp. NPDC094472]|uniref:hypothetical protein n=1 Tax=Streptomyces sp. NPDC094472 TaxID=3155080 RepID=UPI00331C9BC1
MSTHPTPAEVDTLMRTLVRILAGIAGLALIFTAVNVTLFAVDHHIPWPIALLLDPMVALTLATVLYADARLAAWNIPPTTLVHHPALVRRPGRHRDEHLDLPLARRPHRLAPPRRPRRSAPPRSTAPAPHRPDRNRRRLPPLHLPDTPAPHHRTPRPPPRGAPQEHAGSTRTPRSTTDCAHR